jgi:MRG
MAYTRNRIDSDFMCGGSSSKLTVGIGMYPIDDLPVVFEITEVLISYFDTVVEYYLLYAAEKKRHHRYVNSRRSAAEVYGVEYLLRLFAVHPDKIVLTEGSADLMTIRYDDVVNDFMR